MATEQEQARSGKIAAAYLPFKTFLAAIETLQTGIPPEVDRSVWRSQSGAVQSHILSALRFLNLIDEKGRVQPKLKELVDAKDDNRRTVLREILQNSYSTLIPLAQENASQKRLEDALRDLGAQGTTLVKATRFYLTAADYVKLPKSNHWKSASVSVPKQSKTKKDGVGNNAGGRRTPSDVKPRDVVTAKLKSGGVITLSVETSLIALSEDDRQFVFGLIDQVKAYGREG